MVVVFLSGTNNGSPKSCHQPFIFCFVIGHPNPATVPRSVTAVHRWLCNGHKLIRDTEIDCEVREETNKMQQLRCLLSILSQHVSGIIMPIFRRTRRVLPHVVCCARSAGCGW